MTALSTINPMERQSLRVRVFSFRTFHLVLLLLSGLGTLFFIAQAIRFLPVTGDNVYPEAAGVFSAHRWAGGLPLYEDYRRAPYVVTAFPPLWYAVVALAARLGASSMDSLTLCARLLSFVSLLTATWLGYRWNRAIGISPRFSVLTVTFYLAFPILIPWAVAARFDFPAILLGFLAVYFVGIKQGSGWIMLAGVAASLAFLVRHNAVAAPVAIVLWLLATKRLKHAVVFCAVWVLVVVSTFADFQHSSHGLLLFNLSAAKFGKLALTYARDVLFRLLLSPGNGFATVLFVFGALGLWEARRKRDTRQALIGLYLAISFGLALLSSAAAGAAVNHYMEASFAMAVLLPFGVGRMQEDWNSSSALGAFASIVSLVVLLPSLDMQRWNLMHNRPADMRPLVSLVKNRKVLTDVPYLAARSLEPQLLDLASLVNSSTAGKSQVWSERVAATLKAKDYEVVVLGEPLEAAYVAGGLYPRYPHLDATTQAAIRENYGLCFEASSVFVYAPLLADSKIDQSACPASDSTSSPKPASAMR